MLNVERHSLERAFRLTIGMSWREARRNIMGEQAIKLLKTAGNLSVKEVAFAMGFGSQRSFGRFIKSRTGLSPTMLRASIVNVSSDAPQMSNKVPLPSSQSP